MRVSLFITCLVDQFFPDVGMSVVSVLRKLGVEVDFPAEQTCCGQPAFNSGFTSDARELAKRFIGIFENSDYVVAPSGSCTSMVKVFYPELFKDDPEWLKRAESLASRTYEFTEFLVNVLKVEDVGSSYHGKVALHQSCHLLRELNVRSEPQCLLRSVKGIEVVELERAETCCGFGGLFSVKYPHISGSILQDKIDSVEKSGADVVVASDVGCLMHIAGGLSRQSSAATTMHIAELLAKKG
ncbi:MAG TPA: (Fe-S)-binding protein [Blastocatellia bacterium]|jgi:L-lactate dehydrogenase complex protein LldE|nr:(Fe-S)-binding protein [Blastocatellia bacterium]